MGNVKRGTNIYRLNANVAPGDMATVFAPLGNTIIFHYKASSTTGGVSSAQSYANNNPFPSYGSVSNPAMVGDIVVISGLAAEVDISVLGTANFFEGGGGGLVEEVKTTTPGQTSFTTTRTIPTDYSLWRVYRNGVRQYSQSDTPNPDTYITRTGANTFTINPAIADIAPLTETITVELP